MNKNIIYKERLEEKISMNFDFTKVIKIMVNIFYKRKHIKKEGSIYEFDEI